MDPWNPFVAETHVERVSGWRFVGEIVFTAALCVAGVWLLAVFLLSLERAYT